MAGVSAALAVFAQTLWLREPIQALRADALGDAPEHFHVQRRFLPATRAVDSVAILRDWHALDAVNGQLLARLAEHVRGAHARAHLAGAAEAFVAALPAAEAGTDAQRALLARALALPVALVFGPPGSGKTSRGLRPLARYYTEQLGPGAVLCLAPTGKAYTGLAAACAPRLERPTAGAGADADGAPNFSYWAMRELEVDAMAPAEGADCAAAPRGARAEDLNVYLRSPAHPPDFLQVARPQLYATFGLEPPRWPDYSDARPSPLTCGANGLSGTISRFVLLLRQRGLQDLSCPKRVVVVVDEMSMVSAELLHGLLRGLLQLARQGVSVEKIVLCGDDRQLPSVGYGNVFAALLRAAEWRDARCEYATIHRQSGEAAELLALVSHTRARLASDEALVKLRPGALARPGSSFVMGGLAEYQQTGALRSMGSGAREEARASIDRYVQAHADLCLSAPVPKVISHRHFEVDAWNEVMQARLLARRQEAAMAAADRLVCDRLGRSTRDGVRVVLFEAA